jgi:septum formation protein
MRFVLASASPRRKELLRLLVPDFEVIESTTNENIDIKNAPQHCMRLSFLKASDVAARAGSDAIVIGADTVVCLKGQIMGKPEDKQDAFRMLKALSGRRHFVYTGVTISHAGRYLTEYEKTAVTFAPMTDEQITEYIHTEEPMDKAGAYGIQGYASRYIRKIDGCFFNVVGLPVFRLHTMLKKLGV